MTENVDVMYFKVARRTADIIETLLAENGIVAKFSLGEIFVDSGHGIEVKLAEFSNARESHEEILLKAELDSMHDRFNRRRE